MSELHLDIQHNIRGGPGLLGPTSAGHVTLKIDIDDIARASERDLRFVQKVIELMACFVSPPPAVPDVLAGLVKPVKAP